MDKKTTTKSLKLKKARYNDLIKTIKIYAKKTT